MHCAISSCRDHCGAHQCWPSECAKFIVRLLGAALFICSFLTAGALPASAQTPTLSKADAATSSPPKQAVTVKPAADDAEISKRLQGILKSTGWFVNPRVSVRQGVVSLDGETDTQENKSWAGALAEKTQDVVATVNRIKVVSDVGSTFGRAGEEIRGLYESGIQSWPLVVLSIVILILTWLIAKLLSLVVRKFFSSRVASPLLRSVIVRAFSIPVWLLGVYFILQVAGLTRLALTVLGGTGLVGLVLGFAFRDIAENFLASLLLSIRNPFRSGDFVDVAQHRGIVLNLNTRSTILLTLDGSQVQIPNATVYKSTIENFSSNPTRRANFAVGIGYDSSAAMAQSLIKKILCEHPAVLDSPEPLVLVEELGAATVNLRIYYWFDSRVHAPIRISSALLRQTKNVLVKNGIELPDPAREVIFPRGVPVSMLSDAVAGNAPRPSSDPTPEHLSVEADETSDITESEGNLASDANEIRTQAIPAIAEGQENLLKE